MHAKLLAAIVVLLISFCILPLACGQQSFPAELGARLTMYHSYAGISAMVKGGTVEAHWMLDGSSFWYAEGSPDHTVIYKYTPGSHDKVALFDTARLREALTPVLGHEVPYQGLPFDSFTFVDNEEKTAKFSVEGREFTVRLDTYAVAPVAPLSPKEKAFSTPQLVKKGFMDGMPDVTEILSPDKKWLAGIQGHNLSVRSTYDGRTQQITRDGETGLEWSLQEAKWSPDSLQIALLKEDTRKVPLVPIVHWLKPIEEVEWAPYTKSGGPMAQSEVAIVDIVSQRVLSVDTGKDPDQILQVIAWRPDGSEVLVQKMDREKKHVWLYAANASDGSSRQVLTESTSTFLPLTLFGGYFGGFCDAGKKFIWMSERDGWNHLYLYSIDGSLIRKLTPEDYPVSRVVRIDDRGGWVYFTGHGDRTHPYDTHLYRVSLQGGAIQKLTDAPGVHDVPQYLAGLGLHAGAGIQMSPSNQYFLDTYSSLDQAPVTELRSSDGKLIDVISRANTDGLKPLHWSPPEQFVVKAADEKTDLYGILFKPWDFDPHKKYPVIDAIYAGPQTTWVPRTFNGATGIPGQAMAQLGYVVLMVDARGTPERGKAFQDVVYGNFGHHEIEDHVAVLKQLQKDRPYMDLAQVGIFGGSFGGYFTIRAMLQAPDVYKVGVSAAPVVDPYDTSGGGAMEMYLGLPEHNPKVYEDSSSLPLAANLQGHLLIIHGTSDVNADFAATMKMAAAFIRAGKFFDLLIMPEMSHWPQGNDGVYVDKARVCYFLDHLPPTM
jgi:dipeptidyl aminopeptidase/acylaminoacyl peptidase